MYAYIEVYMCICIHTYIHKFVHVWFVPVGDRTCPVLVPATFQKGRWFNMSITLAMAQAELLVSAGLRIWISDLGMAPRGVFIATLCEPPMAIGVLFRLVCIEVDGTGLDWHDWLCFIYPGHLFFWLYFIYQGHLFF